MDQEFNASLDYTARPYFKDSGCSSVVESSQEHVQGPAVVLSTAKFNLSGTYFCI
jgi:hypothetical protein